jgi:hypothetical protein
VEPLVALQILQRYFEDTELHEWHAQHVAYSRVFLRIAIISGASIPRLELNTINQMMLSIHAA